MSEDKLQVKFTVNEAPLEVQVTRSQTLLALLREKGFFSVKDGCSEGDCGICTVLLDDKPVRSCMLSAVEANGRAVLTVEGLTHGGMPHPIQQAFMERGAIQCGFCTPSFILLTKALLNTNPNPSLDEIREALHGDACRCTGYVRIIDAVQRAAAMLRGESVQPVTYIELELPQDISAVKLPQTYYRKDGNRWPLPPLVFSPRGMSTTKFVGKAQKKVDAEKLAAGRPVFTNDLMIPGMLYGALLTSPHAHARIREIDVTKARRLPGVHAVLTYKDIPRVKFSSGGDSYPEPLPYDQVTLDNKVRHVGDRVAVVAAETAEIARKALRLIDVEYEVLPAVFGIEDAMRGDGPVVHDELDTEGIFNAGHNVMFHHVEQYGDVEKAFLEADQVIEGEYRTPKQQHAQLERHTCITWWDEDKRLFVRTPTQVPFHIRRMIAPVIGLPVKQIRIVKPRIGGAFGGKNDIVVEDLCALLTITTGKPVMLELTRRQEFLTGRSRHPQIIHYKVGVKGRKVTALDLYLRSDTGAYASVGVAVAVVGPIKSLMLYNPPNARVTCDVVYTNTQPSGAFRGFGAMQEQFGIEVLMEEVAEKIGLDVVEFKKENCLKTDEPIYRISTRAGKPKDQYINTSGFEQCVAIGVEATDFFRKRKEYQEQTGKIRKGIGFSIAVHGSGIAGLDMAAATMKMNDDGSFNLLVGASDLGTGSDTVLAQIAAEVLQIPVEDFVVYSSDTDFTPFDKGAYASSTTYVSGGAVRKVAEKVRNDILAQAAVMLDLNDPEALTLNNRIVSAPDGRTLTFEEIALSSLHQQNQHQVMATASHMSMESPPPTAANFVELDIDTETGEIHVERMLMVVDCGRVINPITAVGQVEGGMAQALGFVHTEDTFIDQNGKMLNASMGEYHTYSALEMPPIDVIFVQTDEPSGPFGAKSVAEIAIDGVAPAFVSAVHNACGVWFHELPLTPERIWRELRDAAKGQAQVSNVLTAP